MRPITRLIPAALALGAALALSTPASADYWNRTNSTSQVDGRLVDVSVMVDGSTAPLYHRAGNWDRNYFQAFRGRNYALAVTNNTGQRIGVLIAVDGLNVVNGERSNLSRGEAMYVLDPWEHAVIRGWRTSLSDVRRFVFVDEERSYAERTGQANGDMGWIRVLAFREDRPAWRMPELPRVRRENEPRGARPEVDDLAPPTAQREKAGASEQAPAPTLGGELRNDKRAETLQRDEVRAPMAQESAPGTGWGERRYDPVNEVEFVAERNAVDRINLRYEYESGLRALGIVPKRDRVWERERGELGFAKPPKW
jgi:hypothetical protein